MKLSKAARKLSDRLSKQNGAVSGFSLIELLAVVIIAIILASLSIVGFNEIGRSTRLSMAAAQLKDQIQLARQTAITMNRRVTVQVAPIADSPESWAVQTFFDETRIAATPINRFPTGIGITTNSSLTTLSESSTIHIKDAGTPARELRFRPNGSVTQSSSNSLITVQPTSGGHNFITLQIDAITGRVISYQP